MFGLWGVLRVVAEGLSCDFVLRSILVCRVELLLIVLKGVCLGVG